ncbi:MAG: hypothetical protein ONB11_09270 [candidate division KSB1 bacterium]|nr:hypothetical protein [candidate division KSB1 bacterium]
MTGAFWRSGKARNAKQTNSSIDLAHIPHKADIGCLDVGFFISIDHENSFRLISVWLKGGKTDRSFIRQNTIIPWKLIYTKLLSDRSVAISGQTRISSGCKNGN